MSLVIGGSGGMRSYEGSDPLPIIYLRDGSVFYETAPSVNPIYKWLWRRQKLKVGYQQDSARWDRVYKVRCEARWWGIEVFKHFQDFLKPDSCAVIREAHDVLSWLEVVDGELIEYRVLDIELAREKIKKSQNEVLYIGLSERDIHDLQVVGEVLTNDRCVEEVIATAILHKKPFPWLRIVSGLLVIEIFRTMILLSTDHTELTNKRRELESLKSHHLCAARLPKFVPWWKIVRLLFDNGARSICITGTIIRVLANSKFERILKKHGLFIKKPDIVKIGAKDLMIEGIAR